MERSLFLALGSLLQHRCWLSVTCLAQAEAFGTSIGIRIVPQGCSWKWGLTINTLMV